MQARPAIAELGCCPRALQHAADAAAPPTRWGSRSRRLQNHFFSKVIAGATGALVGSRYQLIIAAPVADPDDGGPGHCRCWPIARWTASWPSRRPSRRSRLEDPQRTLWSYLGRHDNSRYLRHDRRRRHRGLPPSAVRHLYEPGPPRHRAPHPQAGGGDQSGHRLHALRARGYELAMADARHRRPRLAWCMSKAERGGSPASRRWSRPAPRAAPPRSSRATYLISPKSPPPLGGRAGDQRTSGSAWRTFPVTRVRRHRHRRSPAGVHDQHQPVRHPDGRDRRPAPPRAYRRTCRPLRTRGQSNLFVMAPATTALLRARLPPRRRCVLTRRVVRSLRCATRRATRHEPRRRRTGTGSHTQSAIAVFSPSPRAAMIGSMGASAMSCDEGGRTR